MRADIPFVGATWMAYNSVHRARNGASEIGAVAHLIERIKTE